MTTHGLTYTTGLLLLHGLLVLSNIHQEEREVSPGFDVFERSSFVKEEEINSVSGRGTGWNSELDVIDSDSHNTAVVPGKENSETGEVHEQIQLAQTSKHDQPSTSTGDHRPCKQQCPVDTGMVAAQVVLDAPQSGTQSQAATAGTALDFGEKSQIRLGSEEAFESSPDQPKYPHSSIASGVPNSDIRSQINCIGDVNENGCLQHSNTVLTLKLPEQAYQPAGEQVKLTQQKQDELAVPPDGLYEAKQTNTFRTEDKTSQQTNIDDEINVSNLLEQDNREQVTIQDKVTGPQNSNVRIQETLDNTDPAESDSFSKEPTPNLSPHPSLDKLGLASDTRNSDVIHIPENSQPAVSVGLSSQLAYHGHNVPSTFRSSGVLHLANEPDSPKSYAPSKTFNFRHRENNRRRDATVSASFEKTTFETSDSKHQTGGQAWPSEFIPGQALIDYPVLFTVPDSGFQCQNQDADGFYADTSTEARCQAFWVCHNKQQDGFLCPNGTMFNQRYLTCDWWFNVKCKDSPEFYHLNKYIHVLGSEKEAAAPEFSPESPSKLPEPTLMSEILKYPRIPPMFAPVSSSPELRLDSASEKSILLPGKESNDDLSEPDAVSVLIKGGLARVPSSTGAFQPSSLPSVGTNTIIEANVQQSQNFQRRRKRDTINISSFQQNMHVKRDLSASTMLKRSRPKKTRAAGSMDINASVQQLSDLAQNSGIPSMVPDFLSPMDRGEPVAHHVPTPMVKEEDKVYFPVDSKGEMPHVEEMIKVEEPGDTSKSTSVKDVLPSHFPVPGPMTVLAASGRQIPGGAPSAAPSDQSNYVSGQAGHPSDPNASDKPKYTGLSLSEAVQLPQSGNPTASGSPNTLSSAGTNHVMGGSGSAPGHDQQTFDTDVSITQRQNGNSHLTSPGKTALSNTDMAGAHGQSSNALQMTATSGNSGSGSDRNSPQEQMPFKGSVSVSSEQNKQYQSVESSGSAGQQAGPPHTPEGPMPFKGAVSVSSDQNKQYQSAETSRTAGQHEGDKGDKPLEGSDERQTIKVSVADEPGKEMPASFVHPSSFSSQMRADQSSGQASSVEPAFHQNTGDSIAASEAVRVNHEPPNSQPPSSSANRPRTGAFDTEPASDPSNPAGRMFDSGSVIDIDTNIPKGTEEILEEKLKTEVLLPYPPEKDPGFQPGVNQNMHQPPPPAPMHAWDPGMHQNVPPAPFAPTNNQGSQPSMNRAPSQSASVASSISNQHVPQNMPQNMPIHAPSGTSQNQMDASQPKIELDESFSPNRISAEAAIGEQFPVTHSPPNFSGYRETSTHAADALVDAQSFIHRKPESSMVLKKVDTASKIENNEGDNPNTFLARTQVEQQQLGDIPYLPDSIDDPSALNREMPSQKLKGELPQKHRQPELGPILPGKKSIQITSESMSRVIKNPSRFRSAIKDPAGIDPPDFLKPPKFAMRGFDEGETTTAYPGEGPIKSRLLGAVDFQQSNQPASRAKVARATSIPGSEMRAFLTGQTRPGMNPGMRSNFIANLRGALDRGVPKQGSRVQSSMYPSKDIKVDFNNPGALPGAGAQSSISNGRQSKPPLSDVDSALSTKLDTALKMVDNMLGPPPFKPKRTILSSGKSNNLAVPKQSVLNARNSVDQQAKAADRSPPLKSDLGINLNVFINDNSATKTPPPETAREEETILNIVESPEKQGEEEEDISITSKQTANRKKPQDKSKQNNNAKEKETSAKSEKVIDVIEIKTPADNHDTDYDYDFNQLPSWMKNAVKAHLSAVRNQTTDTNSSASNSSLPQVERIESIIKIIGDSGRPERRVLSTLPRRESISQRGSAKTLRQTHAVAGSHIVDAMKRYHKDPDNELDRIVPRAMQAPHHPRTKYRRQSRLREVASNMQLSRIVL